jgi:hypothetical protein
MNKFVKYLLCILFSILAINFLVSAVSFFKETQSYLIPAHTTANPTSEDLVSIATDLETQLDTVISDLKEQNGEDYPALGVMYYRTVAHYSSVTVVQNFIFTLIAGFALGNIIFFVFISGLKSYKLFFAIVLSLFVVAILLSLSDIYTAIANSEEVKFGLSEIFWNMEVSGIVYIIVTIIAMFIHTITKTYYEIKYSED